ncbi:MAG: hypothetical protein QXI93_00975 [Candidatus Methanomethylicia archaeon]
MDEEVIQCPCGALINDPKQYKLVFLRRESLEIDILCPNDFCYLKEIGYIKFEINDDGEMAFKKAEFHTPFVTWNSSRIGYEKTAEKLRDHLRKIVLELIDWEKVKKVLEEKDLGIKFEDLNKYEK